MHTILPPTSGDVLAGTAIRPAVDRPEASGAGECDLDRDLDLDLESRLRLELRRPEPARSGFARAGGSGNLRSTCGDLDSAPPDNEAPTPRTLGLTGAFRELTAVRLRPRRWTGSPPVLPSDARPVSGDPVTPLFEPVLPRDDIAGRRAVERERGPEGRAGGREVRPVDGR